MTLGERLRMLRQISGLSQEDVAQKLFVSRQSVSKWELDQAEPGVENLRALATLYGVTLDELLSQSSAAPSPELPTPPEDRGAEEARETDGELVRQYRILFAVRTAVAVLTNLLFALPAARINFPFDWIAMLVGLFVRKNGTWWAILICLGVSIFLNVLSLSGVGLLGLILNGAFLWGVCREEIRSYFQE